MKPYKAVFILSLTAVASTSFAADQVHWTVTGQNSVTVDWHGTSSESLIRYGTAPGIYDNQATAVHPSPRPSSPSSFWETKITGLAENTLYYYAIGTGAEHSFRTPPPLGSSDFIVDAEADVGNSANANMPHVQALIAEDLPRFVLVTGDLAYGDTGGLSAVVSHFNEMMDWSQDAAYMPIWGNHDWSTSTSDKAQINEYEGRFDFPNSQTSLGAGSIIGNGPGEDWYWFDYGNVRFIAYPEPYSGAWPDWNSKAKTLMDAAQANTNINFIVTFGHRPPYSSGYHAGNSTIKGILDGLGSGHSKYVLNISGHSHDYERTFPQYGVTHITVGTGGKGLDPIGPCFWNICMQPDWSEFRAFHHGIVQFHFTKTGIEGLFICGPAEYGKNDVTCNSGEVIDAFTIGTPTADNINPTVNITAPASGASVSGTISVSANASDNIGIAGVQFRLDGANLGSQDTTFPYSSSWNTAVTTNGTHSLTAVATDTSGNQHTSGSVSVTVNNIAPPAESNAADIRISANSDDAEERTDTNAIDLNSADLELTLDAVNQIVGMRFNTVGIPKGATITNAYLQFKVDEIGSTATALQIFGQAADNPTTFISATGNISSRSKTAASVSWSPTAWATVGTSGTEQRSPNLKTVIQEIINRPGWSSNNSLAILITGTGRRTAVSFNGDQAGAPLLHVEYSTAPINQAPNVNAGADQSIILPNSASLIGTATDDNLPSGATLSTVWSKVSGPGTVVFTNANAKNTTANFSIAGSYVLRLSATDSLLSSFDELTVTVEAEKPANTLEVRVSASTDDAEEYATGHIDLSSTDLELTFDSSNQIVGMRFSGISIPKGAVIKNAYLQFTVDETGSSSATELQIWGQAIDNAPTFTNTASNISLRKKTASVPWNPAAWPSVGAAGADQRTSDIKAVIQEIVNRPGWVSGNALVLMITGADTNKRVAKAYDGVPAAAPQLHINY